MRKVLGWLCLLPYFGLVLTVLIYPLIAGFKDHNWVYEQVFWSFIFFLFITELGNRLLGLRKQK